MSTLGQPRPTSSAWARTAQARRAVRAIPRLPACGAVGMDGAAAGAHGHRPPVFKFRAVAEARLRIWGDRRTNPRNGGNADMA